MNNTSLCKHCHWTELGLVQSTDSVEVENIARSELITQLTSESTMRTLCPTQLTLLFIILTCSPTLCHFRIPFRLSLRRVLYPPSALILTRQLALILAALGPHIDWKSRVSLWGLNASPPSDCDRRHPNAGNAGTWERESKSRWLSHTDTSLIMIRAMLLACFTLWLPRLKLFVTPKHRNASTRFYWVTHPKYSTFKEYNFTIIILVVN
jgi:hypothetical protein